MKIRQSSLFVAAAVAVAVVVLTLMMSVLSACGGDEDATDGQGTAPVSSPTGTIATPDTSPVETPLLSLSGPDGAAELTYSEITELAPFTGWAGMKTQAAKLIGPDEYTGVTLVELAELVGGASPGSTMTVTAADGYAVDLTYEQLQGDGFVTYDAETGEETAATQTLTPMLAYERGGEPLDPERDGRIMVQIAQPDPGQLVDARWAVSSVVSIEIASGASQ